MHVEWEWVVGQHPDGLVILWFRHMTQLYIEKQSSGMTLQPADQEANAN